MKNYNYKEEIMFYLWDDCMVADFAGEISNYFKSKYNITTECHGKDKEYINIKFLTDDNYVQVNFQYDESLFYNCYKNNGVYECEKYIGTRAIIHKLISYLFNDFLIITKKEHLLCHKCGKPTGIVFNDYEADERSISSGGRANDDTKQLYDYYEEGINKCYKCGNYFCDDCSRNLYYYEDDFICEDCDDDKFYNYNCDGNCDECIYNNKCNYEENLLDSNWVSCEFDNDDDRHKRCDDCEHRDSCIESAEDSKIGYSMFVDSIVGCGYDSMDDFWECNGI